MRLISDKCPCGLDVKYITTTGYACNKISRCAAPESIKEIMEDPNHPHWAQVKEILEKIQSGELQLS